MSLFKWTSEKKNQSGIDGTWNGPMAKLTFEIDNPLELVTIEVIDDNAIGSNRSLGQVVKPIWYFAKPGGQKEPL